MIRLGKNGREKGGQATFSGRKNEKKGGGRLFQEKRGLSLGQALPSGMGIFLHSFPYGIP